MNAGDRYWLHPERGFEASTYTPVGLKPLSPVGPEVGITCGYCVEVPCGAAADCLEIAKIVNKILRIGIANKTVLNEYAIVELFPRWKKRKTVPLKVVLLPLKSVIDRLSFRHPVVSAPLYMVDEQIRCMKQLIASIRRR
jgi:hypothetical protein